MLHRARPAKDSRADGIGEEPTPLATSVEFCFSKIQLRRERIAERIRALQDLVPSVNKTDKATMLDETVDYVKFLRLQVKEECSNGGSAQPAWDKWSNDGTERQVAKLMEENVGATMQFLQSKALCIMPISLASAIYHTQPPDTTFLVKPESDAPS